MLSTLKDHSKGPQESLQEVNLGGIREFCLDPETPLITSYSFIFRWRLTVALQLAHRQLHVYLLARDIPHMQGLAHGHARVFLAVRTSGSDSSPYSRRRWSHRRPAVFSKKDG